MNEDAKRKNRGDSGWLGSPALSPFYTMSQTMRLSCTVFKI